MYDEERRRDDEESAVAAMGKKIIIGVIGLMVAGVTYSYILPILTQARIDEPAPQLREARVPDPVVAEATNEEPAPSLGEATVKEKESIAAVIGTAGHPASGTVRSIKTESGVVIRYEDFKTINGPDLYVYLAKDLEANEYINLGELKATEGNINYSVPPGTALQEYPYVLVWCKQFGVLFNYAELSLVQ